MPRRRFTADGRPAVRGRLHVAASAFVLLAALAWCRSAHAESIMRQVFDVEARYGNDPNDVIAHLRDLEVPARASGGDALRAFLAAGGYAHAAIDKPAVADAAVEELTDIGERTHDPAAIASAYTLKSSQLAFAGQQRAAFGWIEEALPYARKNPSPDLHYWVEMTAADLAMDNGQIDEGIRLFEDAAKSGREVSNPRREAQAYQSLVPMRIVKGQIALALQEAALVRQLGARSTDDGLVVVGWMWESLAAAADGQAQRAAFAREQAVEAQREIAKKLGTAVPAPGALVE